MCVLFLFKTKHYISYIYRGSADGQQAGEKIVFDRLINLKGEFQQNLTALDTINFWNGILSLKNYPRVAEIPWVPQEQHPSVPGVSLES